MEETMKCACGGDIQDGACLSCGATVADATTSEETTEEMGSNIEASDEASSEEAAA